jgi:hypothetical protein
MSYTALACLYTFFHIKIHKIIFFKMLLKIACFWPSVSLMIVQNRKQSKLDSQFG